MGIQITTASLEGNSVHKQNAFHATAKSPETPGCLYRLICKSMKLMEDTFTDRVQESMCRNSDSRPSFEEGLDIVFLLLICITKDVYGQHIY